MTPSRPEKAGPGTHGRARCFGRFGPFLVSYTHHDRGLRLDSHEHPAASLNFVLQGSYGETFRGRPATHPPDTLLFKPAGAAHANRFDERARCLLIEIEDESLASMLSRNALVEPRVTRDPRSSLLAVRVLQETHVLDEISAMVIEELCIELFHAVAQEPTLDASGKVARAEELLRDSYSRPWSLREVARAVGLHPAHLGRSFRARYQCTVGEFVRHLRVRHVARELRESDKPIAEISAEAGFADQCHCTRVFRKLVHDSPAHFRARGRSRFAD